MIVVAVQESVNGFGMGKKLLQRSCRRGFFFKLVRINVQAVPFDTENISRRPHGSDKLGRATIAIHSQSPSSFDWPIEDSTAQRANPAGKQYSGSECQWSRHIARWGYHFIAHLFDDAPELHVRSPRVIVHRCRPVPHRRSQNNSPQLKGGGKRTMGKTFEIIILNHWGWDSESSRHALLQDLPEPRCPTDTFTTPIARSTDLMLHTHHRSGFSGGSSPRSRYSSSSFSRR